MQHSYRKPFVMVNPLVRVFPKFTLEHTLLYNSFIALISVMLIGNSNQYGNGSVDFFILMNFHPLWGSNFHPHSFTSRLFLFVSVWMSEVSDVTYISVTTVL